MGKYDVKTEIFKRRIFMHKKEMNDDVCSGRQSREYIIYAYTHKFLKVTTA
jgi:predicted AAA+ superfamily ATPase